MAPKGRGRPPTGNAKISKSAPRVPPPGLAEAEGPPRHDPQAGFSSDAIDLDSPPSPERPSASGRGTPASTAADPYGNVDSPSKRSRIRGEYFREVSMAMNLGEGGGGRDDLVDLPSDGADGLDGITEEMVEEDAQARQADSGPNLATSDAIPAGRDSDDDIMGDDDDITGDEKITTPQSRRTWARRSPSSSRRPSRRRPS